MDLNYHSQFSSNEFFETINERRVLDPVHSFVSFDASIWKYIDTLEFQRLRNIKQLGLSYLVFPSGCHSRFEHSIGTAHLANKQMKYLYSNQPSLKAEFEDDAEKIQRNVLLAGLCHDLGHGPFSHTFDNLIIKKIRPTTTWKHEVSSCRILELLIDNNNIDIEKDDMDLIKDLILGEPPKDTISKWIFEIVANKTNSTDVDKFDYLVRDGYHLGIKETFIDYKTLMKEARVINHELCYPSKHAYKLYDLFQTRYKMFKGVYLNRVTQGIELMLCDVFLEANSKYRFDAMIDDTKEYVKLTDNILEEIEFSSDVSLNKAQELIKKMKKRDIYRYASEIMLDKDLKMDREDVVKAEIASLASNEGINEKISSNDIYLITGSINFGLQNENPVEKTKFFHKGDLRKSFYLKKNDISYCLPEKFCEKFLRIYVSKKSLITKVKRAFIKYCKKEFDRLPNGVVQSDYEEDEINEKGPFQSDKKRNLVNEFESPVFALKKPNNN